MNHPYLTGEKVILKEIALTDIDALLAIENQPALRIFGDDDAPYPKSKESLLKFIHIEEPAKVLGIYLKESQQIIGNISLYNVNQQHLHCEIGLAIAEAFHGLGLGYESLTLLIDFIFTYLPMEKIKLQVFAFNHAAIHLYQKLGFQHEGTLRNEIFRFIEK